MNIPSDDTPSDLWRALIKKRRVSFSRIQKIPGDLISTLAQVAIEEARETFNEDTLAHLLAHRSTTRGEWEHYSSVSVVDFVGHLAESLGPDSILDPVCGTGLMLLRAIKAGKPSIADGVDINENCCKVAKAIVGSSARIHHGDFFLRVGDLQDRYDLIIAEPPLDCRLSDKQRKLEIPGDAQEMAEAIAFWACSHLTDRGMLAMVVSPAVVRRECFRKMILSTGARFRAFIHLPAGMSLETSIPTYMMLIEKGEQKQVFIAQLQSNAEAQQQLTKNLVKNKPKGHPSLGRLHSLDDFKTYEMLDASHRLKQRLRGTRFREYESNEVIVELSWFRRDDFINEPNVIESIKGEPLYLDAAGRVYSNLDEVPRGKKDLVRVFLNEQNVSREYFKFWLSSDVGKLAIESAGGGGIAPALSSALRRTRFHMPELVEQLQVCESLRHLNTLRAEIADIESECWTGKVSGNDVLSRARAVNHEDRYEDWLETLPYPLATILWRHKVAQDDPLIRVLALKDFFEALAAFLATVHLSAFRSMHEIWGEHHSKLVHTLSNEGLTLERATFGAWKCVVEVLSKQARTMLASEKHELVLRMYALRDLRFSERLLSSELCAILGNANKTRNDHIGHGGYIGTGTASAIESELRDMVNSVRLVFGRSWEDHELIKAGAGKHSAGTFTYTVPRLMGTRSQFEPVKRETTEPLDDQSLYLLERGAPRGLKLLPFIRVMASPPNAQNACYFYNRTEGTEQRFVSYHFEDESEVCQQFEDTAAVLKDIMSVPASDGMEFAE